MPKAVTNVEDTTRFDLKSAPPDGFIVLRRMTYGQVVQRRTLTKMSLMTGSGKQRNVTGEMAMASKDVTLFEFSHCIVEHNLEDNDGRKLDLAGVDFDRLDPRVGQEIENKIADMNNFEEEDQEN